MKVIGVLGAGIIGLSTAVQIQQQLPDATVVIIADSFFQDTTSDGAAGIFRPSLELIRGLDRATVKQWSQDSWDFYKSLAISEERKDAGISFISGYHFFTKKPPRMVLEEILPDWRPITDKDQEMFPGPNYPYGVFFTTVMTEPRFYMPWLMKRFRANGGKLETRTVKSLEELAGQYDVVVNCCGIRNRELVGDKLIYPSKGQMFRLKTPWLKHFVYVDLHTWIVPGMETCTVGGTRESHVWDTKVNQKDMEEVLARACKVVPSLRKAEVVWVWAGLRPLREPIRLEKETMHFGNNKTLKVVHNYGHGGNGVGLSWGCGKHATRLVLESLMQPKL